MPDPTRPSIGHCILTLDAELGGPARLVSHLAIELAALGHELSLLFAGTATGDVPGVERLPRGTLPTASRLGALLRPSYRRTLATWTAGRDIVHSHMAWLPLNLYAARAALAAGKPHVVSLHGALDPVCLARSRLLKSVAWTTFQRRALEASACLHATSDREATGMRALGLRAPIAVIPCGVAVEAATPDEASTFLARFPEAAGKRRLLFLARLHELKGIDELARAWRAIRGDLPGWILVVAGPDAGQRAHVEALLAEDVAAGSVCFTGLLTGAMRRAALATADAFVLPSRSESFGLGAVEAMACGIPTLISSGCPLEALVADGAALATPLAPEALATALRRLLTLPQHERDRMSATARRVVAARYAWPSVAARMSELYAWVADGRRGPPPVFVWM